MWPPLQQVSVPSLDSAAKKTVTNREPMARRIRISLTRASAAAGPPPNDVCVASTPCVTAVSSAAGAPLPDTSATTKPADPSAIVKYSKKSPPIARHGTVARPRRSSRTTTRAAAAAHCWISAAIFSSCSIFAFSTASR